MISTCRIAVASALALTLGAASPPASLDVSFENVRSAKGVIRVCMTADPENFPECTDDRAAITRSVRASSGAIRIGGLAHGDYAIAVVHDENGNAKLDTFAGVPKEGIGFSRNPKLGFGPPRFNSARFAVGERGAAQTVRIKYYL